MDQSRFFPCYGCRCTATLAGGRLLRGSADQALQEGERGEAEAGPDPVPGAPVAD